MFPFLETSPCLHLHPHNSNILHALCIHICRTHKKQESRALKLPWSQEIQLYSQKERKQGIEEKRERRRQSGGKEGREEGTREGRQLSSANNGLSRFLWTVTCDFSPPARIPEHKHQYVHQQETSASAIVT